MFAVWDPGGRIHPNLLFMKKLLTLIFSAVLSIGLYGQAQQIKIINFTVKNQLPAVIDNWNSVPGSLLLVAQKPPTIQIKGIRLVFQVRANGAVICSNTAAGGMQVDDFTTRTFSATEIIGALSACHDLKDGSYTICAQFFNEDRREISNEVCKEFRVETPKETDFAPPTLIVPENEKKLLKRDIQKPATFRWTPLVPKPKEPVTYRLKVWQLMQGQSGTQAMQANQPIVTKDVDNITQAVVTGSSIYTGPCKPPYLCDFIWNVQALNKEGKPMGRNNGTSEPFVFKIADDNINTKIDSVDITCCVNGKQNIYIKISNLHLSNPAQVTAIKYRVNGTGPVTTLSPTTPGLAFTIPANSSQVFTGSINCVDSMKTIKFIVDAIWPSDPDNINNETAWDTLKCICDPCKTMGVTLKNDTLTSTASTSGQILLSGVLNGLNPAVVKKITIELVYFNIIQTGDSNCVKCAENKEWGNFIKPSSSAFTGFGTGLLNGINFGREWTWLSTVQKDCDNHGNGGNGHGNGGVDNGNPNAGLANCTTCGTATAATSPPGDPRNNAAKVANPGIIIDPNPNPNPTPKANSFSLPIAVPPGSSLKCCGDKIRVCIRFTIWDFCCHACDVIKCYEIERKAQ